MTHAKAALVVDSQRGPCHHQRDQEISTSRLICGTNNTMLIQRVGRREDGNHAHHGVKPTQQGHWRHKRIPIYFLKSLCLGDLWPTKARCRGREPSEAPSTLQTAMIPSQRVQMHSQIAA